MTRAEKPFEELKDTSLPLPIWYPDGLTKQWKSGKLSYRERGMLVFLQMDPTNSIGILFRRFAPGEPPVFKIKTKSQNPRDEKIPAQAMAALKISKNHRPRCHRPQDLPTWGQIKNPY